MPGSTVEVILLRREGVANGVFLYREIPVRARLVRTTAAMAPERPTSDLALSRTFLLPPSAAPQPADRLRYAGCESALAALQECRDAGGKLRAYRCVTA